MVRRRISALLLLICVGALPLTINAYFATGSPDWYRVEGRFEALVRGWYDAVVAAHGGELSDYPFDLAWRHYRRSTLLTTVYAVLPVGAMDLANERGRELLLAMATRSFTAALDLDAKEFVTS